MPSPSIAAVPWMQVGIRQNQANDVAVQQIRAITTKADALVTLAKSAIQSVKRGPDVVPGTLNFNAGQVTLVPPNIQPFSAVGPTPNVPAFTDKANITKPVLAAKTPRDFGVSPPVVNLGTKPANTVGAAPTFSGALNTPTLPTAPAVDPSEMLSRVNDILKKYKITPLTKPRIMLPVFTSPGTNGISIASPKGQTFSWAEPREDPATTEYLVASLVKSLTEHGFGLDKGIENEIYKRHKLRIDEEYDAERLKESGRMAAQGWNIPTGSHEAGLAWLENRRNRALEEASSAIMEKNAELTFQDRQNVRAVTVQFEDVYRKYIAGYWQRSLEAAKSLADNLNQIYSLQLQGNTLELQKLTTEIALFDAEVKSQFIALEAHEKELQGMKLQADIRAQDLAGMLSYIDATNAAVKVYSAEVEAQRMLLQYDANQLAVYQGELQGWLGQLDGYAKQVTAWAEEVRGHGLEAQNYTTLAQAYSAEMAGLESYNRVEASKADIALKEMESQLEEFKAKVVAYEATVRGEIARVDAESKLYGAKASAYNSQANVAIATAEATAKLDGIRADLDVKKLALAIEENKAEMDNAMRESALDLEATKAIAQTLSQLAASAMSSLNVGANISDTFARGITDNAQYSASLGNMMSYSYTENAPQATT